VQKLHKIQKSIAMGNKKVSKKNLLKNYDSSELIQGNPYLLDINKAVASRVGQNQNNLYVNFTSHTNPNNNHNQQHNQIHQSSAG
jgi:hypothetical protein